MAVLSVGRGDLPDAFALAFQELASTPLPGVTVDFLSLSPLWNTTAAVASWAASLIPAGILEIEPRYRQYKFACVAYLALILPVLRRRAYDVIHYFDPPLRTPLEKLSARLGRPRFLYSDAGSIAPQYYPRQAPVHVFSGPVWEDARRMGADLTRLIQLPLGVPSPTPRADRVPGRRVLVTGAVADPRSRLHYVTQELAGIPEAELWLERHPGSDFLRLARERLAGRVHIAADALTQVDVLVQARIEDPFGLPLLRALNAGVPVVAHHCWPFEWLLRECGFCLPGGRAPEIPSPLIDMRRPGHLRSLLERFFDHREPLNGQARSASLTVRERFSWEVLGPRYAELYRRVAAEEPVAAFDSRGEGAGRE